AFPPGHRPGVDVQRTRERFRRLTRIRIDRGHDRRGIADELDRHAGVGLVVADRQPYTRVAPWHREADLAGDGVLVHAIVDGLPVGLQVVRARRVVDPLVRSAHAGPRAQRVVVADLLGDIRARGPAAPLGDDVHDAADGVGVVDRRLGPADDLDPL